MTVPNELPRNSIVTPPNVDKPNKERLTPVVQKPATVYKKSLGKKFQETFLTSDLHTAWNYVKSDVLVPTIKNTIYNAIMGTLSTMLFNRPNPGSGTNFGFGYSGGTTFINYQKPAQPKSTNEPKYARPATQFQVPLFQSKFDADQVLTILRARIETYGRVSISDVYDASNLTEFDNFAANNYGWTNLNTATVSHVPTGWVINFPQVTNII